MLPALQCVIFLSMTGNPDSYTEAQQPDSRQKFFDTSSEMQKSICSQYSMRKSVSHEQIRAIQTARNRALQTGRVARLLHV